MSFTELILTVTLVVLAGTMWWQKKLTATQLLRDRYQMFFDSWKVEDDDIDLLGREEKCHLFVEKKYMNKEYRAKLQSDKEAAKDYLLIVQLYEYLAFAHALTFSTQYLGRWSIGKCWENFRNEHLDKCLMGKSADKSPSGINDNYFDPYGERWIRRWIDILVGEKDPDFLEVHISYHEDHPQFYRFVNDFVKDKYPEFYASVKDRLEPEGKKTSTDPIGK